MEETQKHFTCAVGGCSLRFTSSDSLTMHQKKHDMVLNIGTGQKTNMFMADQTPTPTRFIRNCEEVGLFQDLQNVNPFEETFRKAVEASRDGGSLQEVQSLHIPTVTDDTLHTPHVFPNITDHTSITNLISSTTVTQTSSVEKSQSREVLDSLQVPTILHTEPAVIEVTETNDLDTDIQIEYQENTAVLVKQEETETSQNNTSRASSVDSGCKISASTVSPRDTVQVVFQMPDGRLVQLSGVSMDSIPSTQLPVQVPPTVVHTAPSPQPSIAPSPMVINTQFVQTTSRVAQQISTVAPQTTVSQPTSISPPSVGSDDTTNNLQTRLSVAKMKLKQRIQFNTKRKLTPARDIETIQSSSKMGTAQQPFLGIPSETDINSSVSSKGKRLLIATHEVDEQRLKFRERNRAAAMRCREKRKHWILDLEKRADETQRVNQQLSAEVTKLRSELVHLKTLLLAHRDCSVTRAMQQGVGIAIARPASTVKTSTMAQLQVQQSAVTIPRLPVTIPGTVNVCPSPEETQPKVVLLSKPAGLKRRRQATLAALAVIENGASPTKDSHVEPPQTAHVVTVAQPMSISPTVSESLQITNNNHPAELKSSLITDSVTTSPQTCLITVTAPTLISTGVPTQGIAIKSGSLTSTSYLMPTKLCLPTTDSTLPQLIKLNSNILKTGVNETVKTNNMTHSNGDSMDSGHGSDIEILAEIPNKTEEKS